jgi:hypothetical protein
MSRDLAIPESAFWNLDTLRAAFEAEDWERARVVATVVGMRAAEQSNQREARELIAAGWRPEPLHADDMVYQWRWRRPSRRAGKPGRLFLSTTQAFNAMKREAGE